jgi:hypothetical protein
VRGRRTGWLLAPSSVAVLLLILGLPTAGCTLAAGGETTTTAPPWALDPTASAGNASHPDGTDWDTIIDGKTWRGWFWRTTAGGAIDVDYLGQDSCAGFTTRAPTVEYRLPEDGGRWVFSFRVRVPTTAWGEEGPVPEGAGLVLRGPDGSYLCSLEYQKWQYFSGPAVEIPSVKAGTYDIWLTAPEGVSIEGELAIATPAATFPPPRPPTPTSLRPSRRPPSRPPAADPTPVPWNQKPPVTRGFLS